MLLVGDSFFFHGQKIGLRNNPSNEQQNHEKLPLKNVHIFLCDIQEKSLKMCPESFRIIF